MNEQASLMKVLNGSKALALIQLDPETHSYSLNADIFNSVFSSKKLGDREIIIISIAGGMRSGKSFMLCLLLAHFYYEEVLTNTKKYLQTGNNEIPELDIPEDFNIPEGFNKGFQEWVKPFIEAFEWDNGVELVTKGIKIWSQPFFIDNKAIFLMDTQGLYDDMFSMSDLALIFTLVSSISSIQIYNVMKVIKADDLQNLLLLSSYPQLIGEESKLKHVIFCVRDWTQSDTYPFGEDFGKDSYVQKKLQIKEKHNDEQKNIRQELISKIGDIKGFLMPHPGVPFEKISKDQKDIDMDEAFILQAGNFYKQLVETIKSHSGGGLTAKKIVVKIKEIYLKANSMEKQTTGIGNFYEAIVEQNNNAIIKPIVEEFSREVSRRYFALMPPTRKKLGDIFKDCFATASKKYESTRKLGHKHSDETFEFIMKTEMLSIYRMFLDVDKNVSNMYNNFSNFYTNLKKNYDSSMPILFQIMEELLQNPFKEPIRLDEDTPSVCSTSSSWAPFEVTEGKQPQGGFYKLPSYEESELVEDSVLSHGSIATIYLATVQDIPVPVVAKILKHESGGDVISKELEVLTKARHPHIVVVFGYITVNARLNGILMEYYKDGTLEQVKNNDCAKNYAVYWMAQCASALKFLHEISIVHRNLKPSNLLLSSNLNILKLSGFGYAKVVKGDKCAAEAIPLYFGTIPFQAPEILEGRSYGYEVDVFSLGMAIFSLFVDKDALRTLNPAMETEDYSASEEHKKRKRKTTTTLEDYIYKMISADAEKRPIVGSVYQWAMDSIKREGPEKAEKAKDNIQPERNIKRSRVKNSTFKGTLSQQIIPQKIIQRKASKLMETSFEGRLQTSKSPAGSSDYYVPEKRSKSTQFPFR